MSDAFEPVRTLAQELSLLNRVLQQNKNQHRGAKFYRKFVEIKRALATFLDASKQNDSPQTLLQNCYRVAVVSTRNSQYAMMLLQQTYFMPFALVILAIAARVHVTSRVVLRDLVKRVEECATRGAGIDALLQSCEELIGCGSGAASRHASRGEDLGEILPHFNTSSNEQETIGPADVLAEKCGKTANSTADPLKRSSAEPPGGGGSMALFCDDQARASAQQAKQRRGTDVEASTGKADAVSEDKLAWLFGAKPAKDARRKRRKGNKRQMAARRNKSDPIGTQDEWTGHQGGATRKRKNTGAEEESIQKQCALKSAGKNKTQMERKKKTKKKKKKQKKMVEADTNAASEELRVLMDALFARAD